MDGKQGTSIIFPDVQIPDPPPIVRESSDILAWLALNHLTACGVVSQRRLLDVSGGMVALCNATTAEWQHWFTKEQLKEWGDFCEHKPGSTLLVAAVKDYEASMATGAQIICAEDEFYPSLLAQIHSAPLVLFVQGDLQNLHLPQIAVVGSRNASAGGTELAYEFSSSLGSQGLTITSGLALGIDGAAHRGALSVSARTIAVVATGLDQVYPRRHEKLAQDILAAGGTLVSEFTPGTRPQAQNFPRRNRIISGLSLGTLVIEASTKSGSLITARYAMEQGREVFALPGSVRSLYHRGCHALIRQGATLVETTDDIAEQLDGLLAFKKNECRVISQLQTKQDTWSADAVRVFKRLDHTPVGIDVLVARCGMPIDVLAAALLDLELEGVVAQRHGFYCRA